jgi:hypothetical protein
VDANEFGRRIAVYIERDLPELREQRERIAEALSDDLWPMVGGWLHVAECRGDLLDWLEERIKHECPRGSAAISALKTGRSGADNDRLRDGYARP